jgi:hypothetical protein
VIAKMDISISLYDVNLGLHDIAIILTIPSIPGTEKVSDRVLISLCNIKLYAQIKAGVSLHSSPIHLENDAHD